MAKVKLTKSVVNAAQPRSADYELRDIVAPGFLCKVTPQGCKVFIPDNPAWSDSKPDRSRAAKSGHLTS